MATRLTASARRCGFDRARDQALADARGASAWRWRLGTNGAPERDRSRPTTHMAILSGRQRPLLVRSLAARRWWIRGAGASIHLRPLLWDIKSSTAQVAERLIAWTLSTLECGLLGKVRLCAEAVPSLGQQGAGCWASPLFNGAWVKAGSQTAATLPIHPTKWNG